MVDLVGIGDSYKYYRQNNPPENWIPNVDYKKGMPIYNKVVNGLIKHMMSKVFQGYDVKLGAKLGIIGIRGEKIEPIIVQDQDGNATIRGVAPDWGATKKLQAADPVAKANRTKVYCFNEHNNGIKYKFFWNRDLVLVKNKRYYSLTFSRRNRRELARLIKQENREYLIKEKKIKNNERYSTF